MLPESRLKYFEKYLKYSQAVKKNSSVPEIVIGRCSVKKMVLEFRKIHRKAPVSESLF